MNILHSTLSTWRDRLAPVSRTSTFRTSGQITPEEFVLAGDYLVYKFPSWSWSDASSPAKRVSYLPPGKQFLVTRGVPCHRRLNDNFAGDAGHEDEIVQDMLAASGAGAGADDEDGWLRTGGGGDAAEKQADRMRDVRTMDESGNMGEQDEEEEEEEERPDMEDDDDDEEAIIREPVGKGATTQYVLIQYKRSRSSKMQKANMPADQPARTTSTSPMPTSTVLLASISPAISPLPNLCPHT